MIAKINKAWSWKGFNATEIISTNEFGNVIFKTDKNEYWRICPEEISCGKIAESESEFDEISSDSEFIEDWEHIQTETYLTLLYNASCKKAEARKRIYANDEDIDEAMKAARKYMRITDYLLDRWDRERKRKEYGTA